MRIVFTPEAERQAEHCDTWWRENRPAARGAFARELADAKALILKVPNIGSVYATLDGHRVRRLLLKKSRNHVYYVVSGDLITVHSVWGAPKGRGPGF